MSHSDPVSLVRAAIEVVNRGDWDAAAQLCDPVSLAAFRRQLLDQFEPTAPRFELTVEDYLRHTPEMPPAVAEYHVAQHRARTDPARRIREELPGIADLDTLRKLSPEAVFAAWLDGRSPQRQIERLVATGRISPARAAHSMEVAIAMYPYVVVGAVADGERMSHVLYRFNASVGNSANEEAEAWLARLPANEKELARDVYTRGHPQVVTCRKQANGGWRLLAGHDFLGMGSTVISDVDEAEREGTASGDSAV